MVWKKTHQILYGVQKNLTKYCIMCKNKQQPNIAWCEKKTTHKIFHHVWYQKKIEQRKGQPVRQVQKRKRRRSTFTRFSWTILLPECASPSTSWIASRDLGSRERASWKSCWNTDVCPQAILSNSHSNHLWTRSEKKRHQSIFRKVCIIYRQIQIVLILLCIRTRWKFEEISARPHWKGATAHGA